MLLEFNAQARTLQGTGASRRLRKSGRVPGVVYGGDKAAQAIDIDHNEIWHKLRQEVFHASILTLKLDGAAESVLLRDVQMHPFKRQILHLDFQRVDAKQAIHLKVPLHFINSEIAPGVKLQGGIVSHVINEVEVKCLPADLPDFIEVDVKDLSAGHSIHLSALVMPKGVEVVAHKGEDPVVVTIVIPRGAASDEAAAAEAPAEKK
ncbi:50S ribosomal protein L25 [Sterolibacterium denitrificans]|uniref:50S ribosomal protein L25 n=2 Tax=Sterolibacterium denitrificans TaxID=157592 RepID=A0A7Z7HPV8_9PROT|nr:50S ribosomal protein L25/general stress protein Ctc [Sterolibacterium denitrificans]KYC28948.1 50S ribosomal protein L25 [Sterolibacterium denitrificans]SMB23186.1 50S ribosomal protein L25 [Sterolibacterium denitrificans]